VLGEDHEALRVVVVVLAFYEGAFHAVRSARAWRLRVNHAQPPKKTRV
jgi:hypothetical protein